MEMFCRCLIPAFLKCLVPGYKAAEPRAAPNRAEFSGQCSCRGPVSELVVLPHCASHSLCHAAFTLHIRASSPIALRCFDRASTAPNASWKSWPVVCDGEAEQLTEAQRRGCALSLAVAFRVFMGLSGIPLATRPIPGSGSHSRHAASPSSPDCRIPSQSAPPSASRRFLISLLSTLRVFVRRAISPDPASDGVGSFLRWHVPLPVYCANTEARSPVSGSSPNTALQATAGRRLELCR